MAQNNNIPENLPIGGSDDFHLPENFHVETTEEEHRYYDTQDSNSASPAPQPTINISNHFTGDPHATDYKDVHTEDHETSYINEAPITHDNHNNMSENSSGASSKVLKYVLIAGFVIILFIVSVALVSYLPGAISSVSSSASAFLSGIFSSKPKIELTIDKSEVASGEAFTVTWKNKSATSTSTGNYELGFKCISGITVQTIGNKPIVCGSSFPIGSSDGSITVVATSQNTEKTDVPFNVSFYNNGDNSPSLTNSASIIVDAGLNSSESTNTNQNSSANQTATSTTATSTTKTGFNPGSVTHATTSTGSYYYPPNGKSDLAITLVKVGEVLSNGTYVNTTTIDQGARVLIQFSVSNEGTAPSGTWSLNASLPSNAANERNFSSGAEPSLRPGEAYTLTLAFDTYDGSSNSALISILSGSDINTANNTLTIPLSSNGSYYNPTNPIYNGGLSVQIENVGLYNRSISQFYSYGNQTFNAGSTVGVQFRVTNNSNQTINGWTWSAYLPTSSSANGYGYNNYYGNSGNYNYTSPAEGVLAPGQSADFTIAFDNPNPGTDTINIVANANVPQTGINSDSRTIYVNNSYYPVTY